MRKIEKNRKAEQEIITIPEDVTIDLGDREVILEKGDKVELLSKVKKQESSKYKSYYKASVLVTVYEDDYEEGEGKQVNNYDMDFDEYSLPKLLNQLEGYIGDKSGWEVANINDYDFASEIFSSRLESASGDEATRPEIEDWEKGEIMLYSAHFHVLLSKVGEFPVPEDEIKKAMR